MLDIQDLRIHFRNAPPGKDAVKGICLHMDRGEILGLVGESGSGKTVTAMALAGLLSNAKTQLTGQIFFEGLDLLQASRETVRALRQDSPGNTNIKFPVLFPYVIRIHSARLLPVDT